MKKILLATTLLAATTGFAAAEVTVSGSARMGVVSDSNNLNFTSRARVVFTASAESDGGLSFGYSVRADNAAGGNNGSAGSVFISGAFGKLSMGDVAGAAEAAVGDLSGVGLTGLGDFSDTAYLTGDGVEIGANNPIALYEYSTGSFTGYLSANDGRLAGGSVFGGGADAGPDVRHYAVGAKYAMGDYSVALGYESADPLVGPTVDHIVGSATAKFGTTSVKAVYGRADKIDLTQYGLSVDSTFDALTVTGYGKVLEIGTLKSTAIGLGASYDLGGGAKVVGGVVNYDTNLTSSNTIYDLGVSMSF